LRETRRHGVSRDVIPDHFQSQRRSNPPGSGDTRIFFVLGLTGVGKKALWRALLRRRHAAMVTRRSTLAPSRCSAILPMARARAVCAVCWRGLAALRSWSSTTGPWLHCPSQRRDFWEICEDRYQVRSTILTLQLPVSRWHEQIGGPTLGDGILDRLVHNASHRDAGVIRCARVEIKRIDRTHSLQGGSASLSMVIRVARIQTQVPPTPFMLNFSCDLRLTAEARISTHAKNTV
jgi:hypothetical protein